ncbi:MAG TPA: bifunctional DNA-formamidopyrimidine glycosylase/DNA-(apurinic or apyrimidinic site) lyase [Streptosporangiaceae bacterium]|nr:bifunctional DNA-formamidopyrimidine glycosylase/DNA-(apurinic or apyrimidinic site) lyase [Streptosporangiaceae bacterium]
MPELPEVETLRRDLAAVLPGRRILSVQVLDAKVVTGSPEITGPCVTGHRIGRVSRRGKVLVVLLDGSGSLLVHPKMTGQLIVTVAGATVVAGGHPTPSMLRPMPNPTTRAIFRLDRAACLYYNDARRFGWIRLAGPDPCDTDPFLTRLGPEPLGEAFPVAALRGGLTRHARAPVKAVLLDQTVVAGIGNIYADEILHRARIHPARAAGGLSPAEARRLHAAIRAVLRSAIETGGTSFAAYVNEFRGQGGYLDHAEVFHRQGQPCDVCGTPIARTTVAGRATNFCPHCQRP